MHKIHFMATVVALAAAGTGCPRDPDPEPAAKPDASGTWVGMCDIADANTGTELDRIDVVMTLTEDAADHTIDGTFDYTQFYTTTTSTYSEVLGVEGARDGNAVTLELQYDTTTTTSTSLVFHLTLDGDTLDGTLAYEPASGYPDYVCTFDR